jgi:hypothetical protein
MVQRGIERHREERKELAGNWKGKSLGRKKGEIGDILLLDKILDLSTG